MRRCHRHWYIAPDRPHGMRLPDPAAAQQGRNAALSSAARRVSRAPGPTREHHRRCCSRGGRIWLQKPWTRARAYPARTSALPVHSVPDDVSSGLKMATSPIRRRTGEPVRDPDQMRPGATRNPVSNAGGDSPGGNRDWQALCRMRVKLISSERTQGLQRLWFSRCWNAGGCRGLRWNEGDQRFSGNYCIVPKGGKEPFAASNTNACCAGFSTVGFS